MRRAAWRSCAAGGWFRGACARAVTVWPRAALPRYAAQSLLQACALCRRARGRGENARGQCRGGANRGGRVQRRHGFGVPYHHNAPPADVHAHTHKRSVRRRARGVRTPVLAPRLVSPSFSLQLSPACSPARARARFLLSLALALSCLRLLHTRLLVRSRALNLFRPRTIFIFVPPQPATLSSSAAASPCCVLAPLGNLKHTAGCRAHETKAFTRTRTQLLYTSAAGSARGTAAGDEISAT